MNQFSIDMHCHPAMKPFGKSFSTKKVGENSTNRHHKTSIWFYDPPNPLERLLQRLLGLVKFTQCDFTTLSNGKVRCICASIYSIERSFVRLNTGTGVLTDFISNLASSLGKDRINFLQSNKDYFSDVENEYDFYLQLHNKEIKFGNIKRKYVLIKSYTDLQEAMMLNEDKTEVETVYVIMSIEGLHNLNAGNGDTPDEVEVLDNLRKMKSWTYRPFYVTFAHHFYNELCGHAETMSDFFQDLMTRQEPGMNTGFTPLGRKVMKEVLDNTDGNRMLIDIKHMSYLSRTEYINYLKTEHAAEYARKEIPLIISHGACNGMQSRDNPNATPGLEYTASRMYSADINFYDDELLEVVRSGGIIGLQLDERRIASKQYKKSLRLELASDSARKHSNSKMLWNNIRHIVELLDMHDMFAWDNIAIGSDNDGMIDPMNMFWTSGDMDALVQYIERHAFNYFNDPETKLKNSYNRIDPSEVIQRIFHSNSMEFFRKYFK
ncbi:MAG: hypothetical protein KDC07_01410 [Chitinophagaceae bacterium]|nr:hypothetical protein [Chitinophagaceae bacterium]MCB9047242.1 peptidase M19 [Chitinophagales bacterium]